MTDAPRQPLSIDPAAIPLDCAGAARAYVALGLRPIFLHPGEKSPAMKDWTEYPAERVVAQLEATPEANLGIMLGDPSGGLIDLDWDSRLAKVIGPRVAERLIGPTAVFGRAGKPAGHCLYLCADSESGRTLPFALKGRALDEALPPKPEEAGSKRRSAMIAEIRATGGQTVFPPSVFADGDRVVWHRGGTAPTVARAELECVVALVCFLCVVAGAWPKSVRNESALHLTAALARLDWLTDEDVDFLVQLVAECAGDEEHAKRGGRAAETREKLKAGEHLTGLPKLCEHLGFGPALEKHLREWVNWGQPKRASGARGPGSGSSPAGRELARALVAGRERPLVRHQGQWFEYEGGRYREIENEVIRGEVYTLAEARGEQLGARAVSGVCDGLETLVLLPKHQYAASCWINGATGPDPKRLLNCANGLLDPETRQLLPHTPNYFTFNRLPYGFDPSARCPRFERFLREVWPDEEDARLVLQEWFGYCLTGDTSQEKILCLIGAKRCGKGTINHTMRAVVGEENVASPKLQSFGETFGRQALIGKRVAILADVRVGPKTDVSSAASTLLEISGRDPQSVQRKFLSNWEGHLEARLVLMSNLPITVSDPAGVLPSRYLTLAMRQSFAGREDTTLKATLSTEAPGVLNWALEGLARLRANGKFTALESSADLQRQTSDLASGLGMFIDERCEFGPPDTHFVSKDGLYLAYLAWFSEQGYPDGLRLSKEMFGAAFVGHTIGNGVRQSQRSGWDRSRPGDRVRGWAGVRRRDGLDLPNFGPGSERPERRAEPVLPGMEGRMP